MVYLNRLAELERQAEDRQGIEVEMPKFREEINELRGSIDKLESVLKRLQQTSEDVQRSCDKVVDSNREAWVQIRQSNSALQQFLQSENQKKQGLNLDAADLLSRHEHCFRKIDARLARFEYIIFKGLPRAALRDSSEANKENVDSVNQAEREKDLKKHHRVRKYMMGLK